MVDLIENQIDWVGRDDDDDGRFDRAMVKEADGTMGYGRHIMDSINKTTIYQERNTVKGSPLLCPRPVTTKMASIRFRCVIERRKVGMLISHCGKVGMLIMTRHFESSCDQL